MHPIAHKSEAGEERLSVRISGDTYCAVPTKLLRRAVPSLELSASVMRTNKYDFNQYVLNISPRLISFPKKFPYLVKMGAGVSF
jgi:hypothetical protein